MVRPSLRLTALAGLAALAVGCGVPPSRPAPVPDEDGWLVVSNPPAAAPVSLRVDGDVWGLVEPGAARQIGPLPVGDHVVGVTPLGGFRWRDFTVTVTSGGPTRFTVPIDATEGGAPPPESPPPEPPAVAPAPAAPTVAPAPPAPATEPPPKRRPRRPKPPEPPAGPAEAPPSAPAAPAPVEAPPAPVEAPPPAPAGPTPDAEPAPPPGKAWLIVEDRSPWDVAVACDGAALGTVAADASVRFALRPGRVSCTAERTTGEPVAERTFDLVQRAVWRINPKAGRLVVENPAGEAFETQVGAEPARRLGPGERLEVEVWTGNVPVRVVGEVSGRRMDARVQVAPGETVTWRTPVVRGSIGLRCRSRDLLLSVTVDGEAVGTIPPGGERWLDLPVGAHEVEVSGGAVWRRSVRVTPGRGERFDVP